MPHVPALFGGQICYYWKKRRTTLKISLRIIKFYQKFISPLSGPSCRFYPTCSQYTYEAIEKYGAMRGMWLGGKRILRCHPFSEGGADPVP